MPRRIRHALRFAVATLFAVYVLAAAWELVDIYLLGNLPAGESARATFLFNEQVFRTIAIIEAAVVFLLRLGDVTSEPPSWRYAWFAGGWVALATLGVGLAVEARQWWGAVAIAVGAIALWYLARDRVPGRPGTTEEFPLPALDGPPERELREQARGR